MSIVLFSLLAPCQVMANASQEAPLAAGLLCRQAISAAERAHGIPSHLLAAIARVESGRRDQASGTFNPWPWTINFDGQGSFYDNMAQAVAAADVMRPRVTRSLDVGCMQISLTYHPDAFASMQQAFDPSSNADYGARFLLQLFEKSNSWPQAVALYHSATPELGQDYQNKVYAALPTEQKLASADPGGLAAEVNRPAGGVSALSWGAPFGRSLLSSVFRPHITPQGAAPFGASPPGRTLDSYRAGAIRFAFRAP